MKCFFMKVGLSLQVVSLLLLGCSTLRFGELWTLSSCWPRMHTCTRMYPRNRTRPYGDRGSKTVKAYNRRVLYCAWGRTAHRGWARLVLDRRGLAQAPHVPRD